MEENSLTRVFIKSDTSENEWDMIELQGRLATAVDDKKSDHSPNSNKKDLQGLEIGHISFKSKKVPVLTIGSHRLEGKIEDLKKELAILEKKQVNVSDRLRLSDKETVFFQIKGIVKRKLIFKTRPKPLVLNNNSNKRIKR